MAFGHTEHSESLLYPSELLSLQVLGLSLFDLTAWANNCVCVWCCFFPPLAFSQLPTRRQKTQKNEICHGPFFETDQNGNKWEVNWLVWCWKMKVLFSSAVRNVDYCSLTWVCHINMTLLYVCVPTETQNVVRGDRLSATSLLPSY